MVWLAVPTSLMFNPFFILITLAILLFSDDEQVI
jgi:hypothetical protein